MMDSNQTTEIAVGTVLVVIATAGVILRFVARVVRKSGIGLDDWLSLASLILIFSLLIELLLWATIGGNGLHEDQVTPEEMSNFLKIFYANELSYVLCSPCIKLCILAFYYKLFVTPVFQWTVKAIGLVTVLFSFSCEVAAIVQCSPVAAAWDKALLMQPGARCFDSQSYFLAFQSINIFLDILILGLPLPIIWNLHRPWQDKLALTFVFVLGGFACAASIYRIVTLFYIQSDDVTYTIYRSTVWTLVEPCLGLLCACLPVIRGLLPRWKPKLKRPSYHSFGMSHLRRRRGNTNGAGGNGSHNARAGGRGGGGGGGGSSDVGTAGSESYHILDGAQAMAPGGKETSPRCDSSTGSSLMESAKVAKTSDESEAGRRNHLHGMGGIHVTTTITHLPLPKTL